MGHASPYCSILFYALLVLQGAHGSDAREIVDRHPNNNNVAKYVYNSQKPREDHLRIVGKQDENSDDHLSSHMDHIDPALNVFFTVKDLYLGKKMLIYFAINDPSTTPHLLPREEADSIPFSSSQLQYLLKFFSFPEGSSQAKAMEYTLNQCELEPITGETKFCATSLESVIDSARAIVGDRLTVLTTKVTHLSNSNTTLLQRYTFVEDPLEIPAPRMVACHTMAYPYVVYYCHGQKSKNKLFKVSLDGENGDKVEAVAICHMDTSQWDHDHIAFRVLGFQPGSSPVCHFFPADNLVWAALPSVVQ